MKRLFAVLMLIALMLSGCANEEEIIYSGVTAGYDIQISDTEVMTIQVPVEAILVMSDNHSHYEFSDGTVIDLSNIQTTTAKLDENTGLYVGNKSVQLNVDDKCVIVSCEGSMKTYMTTYLNTVSKYTLKSDLYKEFRVDKLPSHSEVEMELVENMYMPTGTSTYSWMSLESQIYTEGTSWLQLTIYDYPLDDIKYKLLTQILCNTDCTDIEEWYQDDSILYARAADHYLVAKRIAYNCTYVYTCDTPMLNYALQGVSKVYGAVLPTDGIIE